jgi:hypothetical protein
MKIPLLLALATLATSCGSADNKQAAAPGALPVAAAAPEPTPALIDQKNGFRGHHFGDDIADFKGLKLVRLLSTTDLKAYEPADVQEKKIGETPLLILRYLFYRGKFYEVDMQPVGSKPMAVLDALTSLYGPAQQPNPKQQAYFWTGTKAAATVQQKPYEAPWVLIWSSSMREQIAADRKTAGAAAGKQASADL